MTHSRRQFIKHAAFVSIFIGQAPNQILSEKRIKMKSNTHYEVIIVGGSYSGLAAAMALGRSLRKVLIIDGQQPCNRQTPFSHNFITHDGRPPHEIAAIARKQVLTYPTVHILNDLVVKGVKTEAGFQVETLEGKVYKADRLVFASGVRDLLPEISGLSDCWGISVLHCPYCHGYEVKGADTGILGNGEFGFEFSMLISNWTDRLTLFTNGQSTLSPEQTAKLQRGNIKIVDKKVDLLVHKDGMISHLHFEDGTSHPIEAVYTHAPFEQSCKVPEQLGCQLDEDGYLMVDSRQRTTIEGIYACGDNTTRMRTVANAVAMGTTAGMMLNKEMVLGKF